MAFYFYTGGHMALCSVFLLFYSSIRLSSTIDLNSYLAIFFGVWLSYIWVQLPSFSTKKNILTTNFSAKKRQDFFKTKQSLLQVFTILLIFLSLIFWSTIPKQTLVFGFHLVLLIILYQLPIKSRGIRHIPFFKTFLISYIWATLMTLIVGRNKPLEELFKHKFVENFLDIFFFITSLTLLFDLRDLKLDKLSNLKTLATQMGPKAIKCISILSFCASVYFSESYEQISLGNYLFFLSFFITVLFAHEENNDYYYLAGVDSLIILKSLTVIF